MAKKMLLTIGEEYRNGKKAYITIGSAYRKIKKAFITQNGVYRPCYTAEAFGGYTGDYTVSTVMVDGVECDLYTLTSSGTLKLNDGAQFWMCGGGGHGGSGGQLGDNMEQGVSGGGGGGGYVATDELTSGEYVITIGSAQGDTRITGNLSFTASSGFDGEELQGGEGGSGGGTGMLYDANECTYFGGARGSGAGVSTIPFGVSSLYKHCAGGGGGALELYNTQTEEDELLEGGDGGSNGSDASYSENSAGGERGGGDGCSVNDITNGSSLYGFDADFYGGGGGGSGTIFYYDEPSAMYESGGYGYQGVCYILCPR